MKHSALTMASAVLAVLTLTSCSSGNAPTSGAESTDAGQGRGPITFAQGKDTTGALQGIIDDFNESHPGEEVTFIELPEAADAQRTALVQDFQAGAGTYDVAGLDVVWTSEFAARDWLLPLNDVDTEGLFESTVDSGTYDGILYAAPFNTNSALLFYRTDLVETPPTTWAELIDSCETVTESGIGCYAGQYAQYEGLTANFAEAVNSAGGSIVDDEGNASVNTPEAAEGLAFLVDGFAEGYIPAEAITYQEEESRRAFQSGGLVYLRNWPYVYNLANDPGEDSVVQGKFDVAPIPGLDGVGASTLGGYNMAVSKATKNPQTAQDFINFMLSEESQRKVMVDMGIPSVRESLYDDPDIQEKIPYLAIQKEALITAVARPKAVNYSEFSTAISTEIYKALQERADPKSTLEALQPKLQEIIDQSR